MIPVTTVMACPHLATPATLMVHVAQVESHLNPFAIGVVGGRLAHQPDNLAQAITTARMLAAKGYDFSVGLAQVNRSNFGKYGLNTYQKAFSICGNLLAGSRILAQCYANAHGVWGKAFSCYNSGNYTTGFHNGYVQKMFATFDRGVDQAQAVPNNGRAIPLLPASRTQPTTDAGTRAIPRNSAAYRVAIRSSAVDSAVGALVVPVVARITGQRMPSVAAYPQPRSPQQTGIAPTAEGQRTVAAGGKAQPATVFEPQVTRLDGAAQQMTPARRNQPAKHIPSTPTHDDAFVF